VHCAKLVRRERTEREPDEHREARQAALDAKVAERIDDLAGAAFTPAYDRPSLRQGHNPLTVPCPYCRAGAGYVCENTAFRGGKPRRQPHPSRIDAAFGRDIRAVVPEVKVTQPTIGAGDALPAEHRNDSGAPHA
jgi:hypothetical protein